MKTTATSDIVAFLKKQGIPLFGFADLGVIPLDKRYAFPRAISFAFPIEKKIALEIIDGPTSAYYREYNRLNELLLNIGKDIEYFIISKGFRAKALEATVRKLDDSTLSTILPHKTSATLAGLGWIGKSALLVTDKFGSAMRLSTVLTDMPLETGVPVTESKCGDCIICVTKCPSKAIKGCNWKTGMKREELYDAFLCRKKAKELSDTIGANHTICGICIAHCPHTVKYLKN